MYTTIDFPSKAALKRAVASGQEVRVYQPNDLGLSPIPENGRVVLEGPHYPKPHSWYATVTLTNGVITHVN